MSFRANNCPLFIFVGVWMAGQLFGLPAKAQADPPLECGVQNPVRDCLYRKFKIKSREWNVSLKVDDDQAFDRLGVCHKWQNLRMYKAWTGGCPVRVCLPCGSAYN
jgi:hypothetical protein